MNNSFHRSPKPYSGFHHSARPHYAPRQPYALGFRPPLPGFTAFGQDASFKAYWCETCDRDFRSSQLLEEHKLQHQKCNIDGCQFIAHPNVITKHIHMQHSSGLYSKIANLKNPEEIKKWREERKKKYPTQSNIEKKAAEIKEKIARGETLGLKTDRFAQRNNKSDLKRRCNNAFSNEKPSRDNKRNSNRKTNIVQNYNTSGEQTNVPVRKRQPPKITMFVQEDSNKMKPFSGIQDLIMDSEEDVLVSPETNFFIEDEDSNDNIPEGAQYSSAATVCGALTNLMCNYATSDEDDPKVDTDSNKKLDINTTIFSKKKSEQPTDTITQDFKQVKKDGHSDDDAPDEVKTVKANDTHPEYINSAKTKAELLQKVTIQAPQLNNRRGKQVNRRFRPKLPSTLLQKLLFREMRQERNIILQCVRYILQNNYFSNKG